MNGPLLVRLFFRASFPFTARLIAFTMLGVGVSCVTTACGSDPDNAARAASVTGDGGDSDTGASSGDVPIDEPYSPGDAPSQNPLPPGAGPPDAPAPVDSGKDATVQDAGTGPDAAGEDAAPADASASDGATTDA